MEKYNKNPFNNCTKSYFSGQNSNFVKCRYSDKLFQKDIAFSILRLQFQPTP